MREDMARVIVERPRIKPFKMRKGRVQPLEDMPQHEGMRRAQAMRGERKQLTENLNPFRRYLESRAGRPWSKVYSEICANLRVDSAVQQHVRDHLEDFVAVKPRRMNQYGREIWWQRLYVDPVNGLLCRTDRLPEEKALRRAKRNKPSMPLERISLTPTRELRLISGLWYEMQLAPLPEPVYEAFRETRRLPLHPYRQNSSVFEAEMNVRRLISPPVWDACCNAMIDVGPMFDDARSWNLYRRGQPDRRYTIAKRLLSRQELRRHGINND
jgi:hypothetical protein